MPTKPTMERAWAVCDLWQRETHEMRVRVPRLTFIDLNNRRELLLTQPIICDVCLPGRDLADGRAQYPVVVRPADDGVARPRRLGAHRSLLYAESTAEGRVRPEGLHNLITRCPWQVDPRIDHAVSSYWMVLGATLIIHGKALCANWNLQRPRPRSNASGYRNISQVRVRCPECPQLHTTIRHREPTAAATPVNEFPGRPSGFTTVSRMGRRASVLTRKPWPRRTHGSGKCAAAIARPA